MVNKCKICGIENPEPKHYYSQHRITEANYHLQYYPRINLLTNKPVPFKNRDSYFLNDFSDKKELKTWLTSQTLEKQKEYCKELLIRRKTIKNLIYSPCQIELSSIMIPKMQYLDKLFKDNSGYYKICEELGFINKFRNIDENTKILEGNIFKDTEKYFIWRDTREQNPLNLDYPIQATNLSYGDYALCDSKLNNIFIDRKSLCDGISTLSSGYERFCKEIERCEKDGNYLIMLIEEKLSNLLSFNHLPWVSKKIKADSTFIMHRARELCQKYKNFQIICIDGRKEASRVVKKLLFSAGVFKDLDCMWAYETSLL